MLSVIRQPIKDRALTAVHAHLLFDCTILSPYSSPPNIRRLPQPTLLPGFHFLCWSVVGSMSTGTTRSRRLQMRSTGRGRRCLSPDGTSRPRCICAALRDARSASRISFSPQHAEALPSTSSPGTRQRWHTGSRMYVRIGLAECRVNICSTSTFCVLYVSISEYR